MGFRLGLLFSGRLMRFEIIEIFFIVVVGEVLSGGVICSVLIVLRMKEMLDRGL